MNHRDRESAETAEKGGRRRKGGRKEGVISLLMHWAMVAASANGERQLITLPDRSGATRILTRRKNHLKYRRCADRPREENGLGEDIAHGSPTLPTGKIRARGTGPLMVS